MASIIKRTDKPTIVRGMGSNVVLTPRGTPGPVGPSGGPIPAGGSPGMYPTPLAGGGHGWDDPEATYVRHAGASNGADDTAALAALLTANATVVLKAGETYRVSTLALPAGVRIIGNGATLRRINGSNNPILTTNDVSDVTVETIVFDGNSANQTGTDLATVLLQHITTAVANVTIRDCVFKDSKTYGLRSTGAGLSERLVIDGCRFSGQNPLTLNAETAPTVRGCTFTSTGTANAVSLISCSNATVTGCLVASSGRMGIEASAANGLTITGCLLRSCANMGISVVAGSADVIISNCNIVGWVGYGIELSATGATITGCYIEYLVGDVNGVGIGLTNATEVTVSGCTVVACGRNGIECINAGVSNVTITGCTINGPGGSDARGIRSTNATNISVNGGLIRRCYVAIQTAGGSSWTVSGQVSNNCTYGYYFDGTADVHITGCLSVSISPPVAPGNGITLLNAVVPASIIGNRITGYSAATGGTGVSMAVGVDFVVLLGNDLRGNRLSTSGTPTNLQSANNFV